MIPEDRTRTGVVTTSVRDALRAVLARTDDICGTNHGFTEDCIGPEPDAILDAIAAVFVPDEKTREQIDAVEEKRRALPVEERQRLDAADASYLRIQLGCMLERAQRAEAARPKELEHRLATMTRLAAAWQKEAEHARRDLAAAADPGDVAEVRLWGAVSRPLTEAEVSEHLALLRNLRMLATEAICIASDVIKDAKKRVLELHHPVTLMGKVWCDECSIRRSTGYGTSERIAYVLHPCPTVQALEEEAS